MLDRRFLFVVLPLLAVAPAAAQTPLSLQFVAAGLTRPVLVTSPPNDLERIFVVQQQGRIRIVRNGILLPTPFLDLTGTGTVLFGGEAGLLGLAFHPNYASNGQFFVYHNGFPAHSAYVRRFTVSTTNPDVADLASGVTLLTTPLLYGNHNGGMLAFGPDGKLYISIGDGGSTPPLWPDDPQNNAQRGDSLLGKLLRIDVDNPAPPLLYGIPANNPFIGPGDPRDEIWALGLRNPWRFSFDRLTGDLYIADVGGQHEEVDFQPAGVPGGRNYGWSCMTGTLCNGLPVCTCNAPALTLPIHEYGTVSPPHAIIGGYVYRGCAIPDLRGAYFFADYMTLQIWSFRRNGSGITQLIDRTAELVPPTPYFLVGPTAFGEDGRGELYLCDFAGQVYKIVPSAPVQAGLLPYGVGTPGCAGAHALTADCSPVVGNPMFTLRCSNAPALSIGLLAIASDADVAGSDPFGFGFLAHVQVTSAFLVLLTMASDVSGIGSFGFPIPPSPPLAGMNLNAQAVWLWSPAVCTPSPFGWSSSPGLSITLQP